MARTVDAEVVPCDFENLPSVKDLPENARCETVFVDSGDLRLRFAITGNKAMGDVAWVQRLKAELQSTSPVGRKLKLAKFVEKELEADWLVRVRERDVILIPAESGASASDATTRFSRKSTASWNFMTKASADASSASRPPRQRLPRPFKIYTV